MAGFIETYMRWTGNHMAPARFHLFNALTVAAHALGRRVWLNREAKKATYPAQMMTLLIGPSGLKKTTSSDFAVDLLHAARLKLSIEDSVRINVMASRMSTEALWSDIVPIDGKGFRMHPDRGDCVGMLYAPEMSATFGGSTYMEGMSTAVTRLNDAPTGGFNWATGEFDKGFIEMSFKKDGPDRTILWNPCVGMLAGTTPDGLADEMPMHIRTTGFLARVMPVWELYSGRGMNLLLGPGAKADDKRSVLVDMITEFTMLSGEARVTPGAQALLSAQWGEGKVRVADENAMLDAFIEREQDHTHRVAMVLACDELIAKGRTGHHTIIWIGEAHYEAALKLIQGCREKLLDCYSPMGRKHSLGLQSYIMYLIKGRQRRNPREKGYSFYRLRKKVHAWSKSAVRTIELNAALRELVELGKLVDDGESTERILIARCTKPGPWSGQPAKVDLAFIQGVNRQLAEQYDGDDPDEWADEYRQLAEEQRRRDRGDD